MLPILLCAQIAAVAPAGDSTYATRALRDFVAASAAANHRAPAALKSYTSRVETETSLLIRDTLGREHTAEVEQFASRGRWARDGRYELHVVGYRSQSVGVPYSTLTMVRGWTVPTLYGERLSLGTYFAQVRRSTEELTAVHPFAADRERYYRFSGGDTVAVLRVGDRSIPIVRIRTRPAFTSETRLAAFDGEIDVDATRMQIVRMRGQLVTVGGKLKKRQSIARALFGVTAVAYIEFVNAEIQGKYWLPAMQRTEFQAGLAILGGTRPVFRLVSAIRDIVVNDSGAIDEYAEHRRVIIDWASSDSVSRYQDWARALGEQSSSVHADDFNDLAPDIWRTTGPARIAWFPNTTARVFRFNRVEGLYLGLAPTVDFRSLAPGLSAGIIGGWAFAEQTPRGGGFVNYRRGPALFAARAERALATTNDFVPPLNDDPGFGALLASLDNYDYVDRVTAAVAATRFFGALDNGLATVQIAVGRDRAEPARLTKGLFGEFPFRPNRGVVGGSYVLASGDLEIHPNVDGDFVAPGLGATLHFETASGDIAWRRVEAGLSARKYFGSLMLAAHANGGMLLGNAPPPQQLFELGGNELLPGYPYKRFAGDRAALFRAQSSYRFPWWRRPIHVGNYFIPGVSPGLAASIQGGWAEISGAPARLAVSQLGLDSAGAPLSRATNGTRATVGGGVTLFSDMLHIGVARPIDRPAPWRFVFGFAASF